MHVIFALTLLAAIVRATPPPDGFPQVPFCKGTSSDEECADRIVSKLTLEEKVYQLGNDAHSVDRLDIEGWNWYNEGCHGQAFTGWATVFPQAITMSSSWDPEMVQKVGDHISTETRQKRFNWNEGVWYAKHGLDVWAPNINILRDPRWGRGQETYGEDPFLTSRYGVHYIKGIQGPDVPDYYKAVATAKHYMAHSGPEAGRNSFDAKVNAFDFEDTYTPAMRAAIVEGKAHSVMCSYNALNGIPTCADPFLLTTQLRNYWGFDGYVVSDCFAVSNVMDQHHYVKTIEEAVADTLNAGCDLECGWAYNAKIIDTIKLGLTNITYVDKAVKNVFMARIKTREKAINVAANPYPDSPPSALEVARRSTVLLKNENNVLPLSKNTKIALVGPMVDLIEVLHANYRGSMHHPVTYLSGFRQVFGEENIMYSQGSTIDGGMSVTIPNYAFRTASGEIGLDVALYNNSNFQGEPLRMVHPDIKYDTYVPIEDSITNPQWSGVWSGKIIIPAAGSYEFYSYNTGANQVTLFLNDQMVINQTLSGGKRVEFRAAGTHDFRLEFTRVDSTAQDFRLQWHAPAEVQIKEAVNVAQKAEVIVAVVGFTPDMENEGTDRKDIVLQQVQEDLLTAMASLGKPLVVIYTGGGMVAIRNVSAADAILHAFYPGEMGGRAVAESISGDNNPGGKMPVTTYRSLADVPEFTDYNMKDRTYRFYKGQVQFPFGHGLSYTKFSFSDQHISTNILEAGQPLEVYVNVTNTGNRDGDEVVQVYLVAPKKMTGTPMNYWLAAFKRVSVPQGQTVAVQMTITPRSLSTVDVNGERAIREGKYKAMIGNGQPKYVESVGAKFSITGTIALPK